MGLPGWTSTKLGLMCLAQGRQHSDTGEAQTLGFSVSSHALYQSHCAPTSIKKIKRKIKALEWSHHTNTVVGWRVWLKIKHIQAFMGVLVTCKNNKDLFKKEGARVVTTDSHCKSKQIYYAQGHLIHNLRLVLFEIQTRSSFYCCPCYLQEWRRSNQKWKR